jgi:hypothetical protein
MVRHTVGLPAYVWHHVCPLLSPAVTGGVPPVCSACPSLANRGNCRQDSALARACWRRLGTCVGCSPDQPHRNSRWVALQVRNACSAQAKSLCRSCTTWAAATVCGRAVCAVLPGPQGTTRGARGGGTRGARRRASGRAQAARPPDPLRRSLPPAHHACREPVVPQGYRRRGRPARHPRVAPVCERLMGARTAWVHAVHGLMRAYGIVLPTGVAKVRGSAVAQKTGVECGRP